MDTDLLVENQIEDGQRLLNQLIRDQFEVAVAFWLQLTEEGLWQLWIASSSVDADRGGAYRRVYATLSKIPQCRIAPSDITLLHPASPIARDAIAARDRYPSRKPTRYQGKRLGNLEIKEAYIYPRRFPWAVRQLPDGHWEVLISEADDVWLACDSEEDARAIAAAPLLEYEALERVKSGPQFAAELQKTADALEKYHMGFGSRFFNRRVQEVQQ